MSCRVTTTDSTSPSSERIGVALTRVVTVRPGVLDNDLRGHASPQAMFRHVQTTGCW